MVVLHNPLLFHCYHRSRLNRSFNGNGDGEINDGWSEENASVLPMTQGKQKGSWNFAKWRAPARIPQVCSLVLQDISDVVSEFWRGMSDDTLSPLLISEAMRARGGLEDRAKGWAATSSALGLNNPPWQVSRDSTKVWTKKSLPSSTHFPLVSRLNLLATPAELGGFSAFGVPSLNYSRPGLIESVSTENASASGPGDFKPDKQGIKIPPEMKIAHALYMVYTVDAVLCCLHS